MEVDGQDQDKECDRTYKDVKVGRKIKVLYDDYYIGHVIYYNMALKKYSIRFDDGSSDYISSEEIDGINGILI